MQWVTSSVSGCRVLEKLLASHGQLTNWPRLITGIHHRLASLGQLPNWRCLEDEYAYRYAHKTTLDFPMSNTVEVTVPFWPNTVEVTILSNSVEL